MSISATRRDPKLRAPFSEAHVLVVDDDTRLCRLLKQYIQSAGYRVTEANDAESARRLLVNLKFDLLVLDVMLAGESGLDLVAWIRRALQTPILLLSALGEAEQRIEGLRQGADDYMGKPFEPRELLLRMRSILSRVESESTRTTVPDTLRFGDALYHVAKGELQYTNGDVELLTGAEAKLMRVFARRPGEALSRETLFAELREGIGRAKDRVIDVRVTRLRRKLELDSANPRYLKTVRGVGYMLIPDGI